MQVSGGQAERIHDGSLKHNNNHNVYVGWWDSNYIPTEPSLQYEPNVGYNYTAFKMGLNQPP